MFTRTHKLQLAVLAALGLSLTTGVGLIGCANMWTALPTGEDVVALGTVQGEDYCAMQRGRALVVTECTSCHRLFWPHEYPPSMWPSMMQDMGRKAVLTKRQIGEMTRYMVAASRMARGSSETTALQGVLDEQVDPEEIRRGQTLASANCKGCHRFRRPSEFRADAWPGILQSHMDGRSPQTYDEMLAIARYYVHESRRELQVDPGPVLPTWDEPEDDPDSQP